MDTYPRVKSEGDDNDDKGNVVTSSEDDEPKITISIVQQCSQVICQFINPNCLAPFLQQESLLTSGELFHFTSEIQSPGHCGFYLIQKLQTKHPNSAQKFYRCLLKEKEHTGHAHIAEVLKEAALKNDRRSVTELVNTSIEISPFVMPSIGIFTAGNTQDSVETYRDYLQVFYKRTFPSAEKRPYLLPNHFANLAIITEDECRIGRDAFTDYSIRGSIDDILHMKQQIHYQDLFKSEEGIEINFVVLEGRPGVGKTTLAQKLCSEWAENTNEMLKRYKLVVLVQLRDFSPNDKPSLNDILFHENADLSREVVNQIGRTNGKDVLLILEGWDELAIPLREITNVQRTKASVFINLVQRVSLTQATILVTSRHVATKDFHGRLHNVVSRFVEVLGLTSDDIRDYIKVSLNDPAKSSDLISQLQDRPHIESMCYIPLNCRIVCELFVEQEGELPSTITEIYSQLIRSILHRCFGDVEYFKSYANIPQKARSTFSAVCKLAFEGIVSHKLVFSQKEIVDLVDTEFSETFDGFGLFQAVQSFKIHGSVKSFHFNHLTFQEYLAAYHISEHTDLSMQLELVTEHVKSDHLNNVWKFYAGISKLKNEAIAQVLCAFKIDDPLEKAKLVCHCAYEAQNERVCVLIAENFDGTIPQFFSVNAYDCLALSYIIANSTDREWSMELRSCGIESSHLRMLAKHIKGLIPESLMLRHLDFSGNPLDKEGLGCFSECMHAFGYIKSLSCRNASIDAKTIEALSEMVSLCPSVVSINLDNNKLTNGSSTKLLQVLQEADATEALSICSNDLGIDDAYAISEYLEKTECLKELKLNKNHLQSKSIPGLYRGLSSNKSLQSLYLEENSIDESGFMILLTCLQDTIVKSLYLKKNNIALRERDISRLRDQMSKLHSLQKVDMPSCKMGNSIRYFVESLDRNNTLKILNFQDNELEIQEFNLICELLMTSTTKRMIDLRPTTITDISSLSKLISTRHSDNWIYFTLSSHKSIDVTILQLKNVIDNNPNLGSTKVVYLRQTINTVHYPENILEQLFSDYCFLRFTKLKTLNLEKIKQSGLEFSISAIQELPDTLKSLAVKQNDVVLLVESKM